jgi:molybdate transport system ATP-binding protein
VTLAVDIEHRQGDFRLDARFAAEGGLTALFGRSGSGKTSLINVIAGLIRPDRGRVVVDGETVVDSERGVFVPVHKRRVGYVFQDGRLFPHLSVRQNLLYGRWFAPNRERRVELDAIADLLGIAALLDRRPARLSGGEKQRVAIGRALLASPRLLLMDEPLAALDEARKAEILPYIERLRDHARVPIVYVSHSIAEVARLATSVVLLADGRVAAAGPLADIMHRLDLIPLTDRGEAGAVIEAVVERHEPAFDLTELRSRGGLWRLPALRAPVGTRLRLRVRARDVMLATSPPSNVSALNVFTGVVPDIAADGGPVVDIKLDCSGEVLIARLTRFSFDKLGLARGHTAHALVKSVALDRRELGGTVRMLPSADAEASES